MNSNEHPGRIVISGEPFPTTPEMVQRGLRVSEVFKRTFGPQLSVFHIISSKYDDVFTGISPESGAVRGDYLLGKLPEDQQELKSQIISFLENNGCAVIRFRDSDARFSSRISLRDLARPGRLFAGKERYSVVNLNALSRVIEHDRRRADAVFPRTLNYRNQADMKKWLQEHVNEWYPFGAKVPLMQDLCNARYGLMSGYPVESARKFTEYHRSHRQISHFAKKHPECESMVTTLADLDSEESLRQQAFVQLDGISDFTPDERKLISILREARRAGDFIAFSEKDKEWRKRLIKMKELTQG